MGRSLDGALAYGYHWNGGTDVLDSDWTEAILKSRGVSDPWDTCPTEYRYGSPEYAIWRETAGIDEWFELNKQVEEEFGVDIGFSGSDQYRVPAVYVAESRFRLPDWGGPIEGSELATLMTTLDTAKANQTLATWFDAVGIPLEAEDKYDPAPVGPGWMFIGSYA